MLSPLVARMIREEEVRNKRKNNSSPRMLFIFKERHKNLRRLSTSWHEVYAAPCKEISNNGPSYHTAEDALTKDSISPVTLMIYNCLYGTVLCMTVQEMILP